MPGDWLTAEEVEREYGFRNSSLEYWRTYGCTALNGAKPRAKQSGAGYHPNLYLRADMEAVAAVPATAGRWAGPGGATWVSATAAEDDFGIPQRALESARQRGRVRSRKVLTVARGGAGEARRMRIRFYSEEDVIELRAALSRGVTPRTPRGWLTAGDARRQFGFSKHALWHWRVGGCPHLGGRKLTARRARVRLQGQPGERQAWVYRRADLEAIAARLASLPGVALADAEGRWCDAASAARSLRVRPDRLKYWRRRGSVRAKRVPCPADKPSGKAHKLLWVYHEADLAAAAAGPDGRTKEGRARRGTRHPVTEEPPGAPAHAGNGGPAQPKAPAAADDSAGTYPRRTKAGPGRRRSDFTQRVYQRTWEVYVRDGKDAALTKAIVNCEFNREVIKDEKNVWLYAYRHARRTGKSMQRPD
jgi:hypothetical protein